MSTLPVVSSAYSLRYRTRNRHAYSLIELIVALAIVAVLVSLSLSAAVAVRQAADRVARASLREQRRLSLDASRYQSRTVRVLFIGNSLTSYNSLPSFVEAMAAADGDVRFLWSARLVDLATLEQHWNEGVAVQMIRSGKWDVVVLQEQRNRPYLDRDRMYKYARLFESEIRASQPDAITLYYLTWLQVNERNFQPAVDQAYATLARELAAEVSPVGIAWWRAMGERPDLQWYTDGIHPTVTGTYLAACVFYGAIFGKSPQGLPATLSLQGRTLVQLESKTAARLQQLAWDTVQGFGPRWAGRLNLGAHAHARPLLSESTITLAAERHSDDLPDRPPAPGRRVREAWTHDPPRRRVG